MTKLVFTMLAFWSTLALGAETITIVSPYSASHSGSPAMFRILEQANRMQSQFNFVLEFKPGGEQILAVRYMDEQPQARVAIIAPKYVEHTWSGRLNLNDYDPVWSLGDACWAVITNVGDERQGVASLQGQRELVVGGVGVGNAAHLTSLQLASRYGFTVRYVPFKSNMDALLLMTGDGSVNMVLERVANYQQMKARNPKLQALAMNCPKRHPDLPAVKTLAEQGITAPTVFNIVIANRAMRAWRQDEIARILTQATRQIGLSTIQSLSDMRPNQFDNVPVTMYYNQHVRLLEQLLYKHRNNIAQ
jgi:tripartite-type tricarboxylate transporter receptor subunit TctC